MIGEESALESWLHSRNHEDREQVVAEYQWLCRRATRRFRNKREVDDIAQVAAIGLIKAVDRYDHTVGSPFGAFAWLIICGEVMHYLRDSVHMLRPPRRIVDLESKMKRVRADLRQRCGREVTLDEVFDAMDATERDRRDLEAFLNGRRVDSLENYHGRADDASAREMNTCIERMTLERLVSGLSGVERTVIFGLYSQNLSQGEIASRIGYSKRQINRIHRSALEKIAPHVTTS